MDVFDEQHKLPHASASRMVADAMNVVAERALHSAIVGHFGSPFGGEDVSREIRQMVLDEVRRLMKDDPDVRGAIRDKFMNWLNQK